MNIKRETSRESKSETCTVTRRTTELALPTACFFDTLWAIGVGTVAAMVSPLLTH